MDLLLSEPQTLFAASAARLCAGHGGPGRLRALRAAASECDREAWRAVIAAEWLATVVSEPHGGQGLGAFDLALAVEPAGRQLLMVPLVEAAATAWTLSRAADGAPAPPALADLLCGRRLIVPATEAQAWRNGACAPAVVYDPDAAVLSGSIRFVAHAGSADSFLVAVESGLEPVLAVIPRSAVSVATELNVDGSTSSMLAFADVELLPTDAIATGARAGKLARDLQEFLILGAAIELSGLAAAALEVTLDYIRLRRQFGRPIGSFQVLQHRAVDGFIDIELDRSLAYRVLAAFDKGEHHPAMVSAAKARASRSALQIVRAALQMHGAIGYTEEHDIGLYYKRAVALAARYGGELGHTGHFSQLTQAGVRMTETPSHETAILCANDTRGVATLTLNRPDKGNSYSHAMLVALLDAFGRLDADPAVRVIVLRGAGRHFCAGAEIGGAPPEARRRVTIPEICLALDAVSKPTVALVHGACIGGAVALVSCCDVVVAARGAFFALPEVRLGFAPGPLIPFFLRAIGARGLRRYLVSGERFAAEEALRLGLVQQLCAADAADTAVVGLVDELLLAGPNAVAHAKLLLRRLSQTPISHELIAALQREFDERFCSAEAEEGRTSFREKRKPSWYPPAGAP